jgi:hypothetical protein
MRSMLIAVLFGFSVRVTQSVAAQNLSIVLPGQDRSHADRAGAGKAGRKQSIADATERLRLSVNGKALVRNHCQSKGGDSQVEESTEITHISGCTLILTTRKTAASHDGSNELEFTVYANLADLTTPASAQPQRFSQCQPAEGAVLKVMSRAQPGKVLRATRRSSSNSGSGTNKTEEPEAHITRSDLSFFFSDAVAANKAARALDQAVKVCGGEEWPDEDDLP